jgi:hypothetical protein
MRRIVFLLLLSSLLIFLHALAMSESTDNTIEKKIEYGFSADRNRWNNYAIDFDDTVYFYDTNSVLRKNNSVKVWIKFGEPINDNQNTSYYKEATAFKEIDCGNRLIRSIEWNYLSMKGEYKKITSPTKWENIEPETADDALLEVVCTHPGKLRKR